MDYIIDLFSWDRSILQKFIFVFLVQFESIATASMYPYTYFMIKRFDVADDFVNVFIYSGYLGAAFSLSQFLSTLFWVKVSKKFGKKQTLLYSCAGTAVSLVLYGMSTTFYKALFARLLMGFFNGYIFVARTTAVGEIAHNGSNKDFASVFSLIWRGGQGLGYIFGMMKSFNYVIKKGQLLLKYPFLTSNLGFASIMVLFVVIGWLVLEETDVKKRYERDIGIEIGDAIRRLLGFKVPDRPWKLREKMEFSELHNCPAKNDILDEEDLSQKETETEEEYDTLLPMELRNCATGVFMISFQNCIYFEFLPVLLVSALMAGELKFPAYIRFASGDKQIELLLTLAAKACLLLSILLTVKNKAFRAAESVPKFDLLIYPIIYFLLPLYVFTQHRSVEGIVTVAALILGASNIIVSFADKFSSDSITILFTRVYPNASKELINTYAMTAATLTLCAAQIIAGWMILRDKATDQCICGFSQFFVQ